MFSELDASKIIDDINKYYSDLVKFQQLKAYPNGIYPLSRCNAHDYRTIIQVPYYFAFQQCVVPLHY